MYLAMTVGAAPIKEENRVFTARSHRVPGNHMALRAHSRIGNFEQPVIDGAMRLVTVGTVIKRWRMLVEKRPAPLGVAGIAVFVHARLFELSRIGRPVRIVATRTGQLAFSHRHVRRAHELRSSLQMALTAYFGLRSIDKKWRDFGKLGQLFAAGFFHQGMAIDAGKASVRMRARCPIGLNAALMTPKTCVVLDLGGFSRIFAKGD